LIKDKTKEAVAPTKAIVINTKAIKTVPRKVTTIAIIPLESTINRSFWL